MKTIFIIASGLADIPDDAIEGKTPLMMAHTPSLDALAKCGCSGLIRILPDSINPTRKNSILGLLGYDFRKGTPSSEELECFDKNITSSSAALNINYFILPKFSGHGVVISEHPEVRGIGKMALLKPVEIIRTGDGVLHSMAEMAIKLSETNEFVLLHVESAASMSRKGDFQGKVDAIERIDQDVITPIADYVWNAKEQMNMVVVSDNIYSWRFGRPLAGEVPAVVYFNDDLPYDTKRFDEISLEDGPLNVPLPGDLIRLLISFEPIPDGMA